MLCSPVQRRCQSKCNVVIFVKTELLHSVALDCTSAPNEVAAECVSVTQVSSWRERICHLLIFTVLWLVKPNIMKLTHKYVHSISLVCLYSILIFYKMSLLWPFPSGVELSVRLTEAFIQSAGISYTWLFSHLATWDHFHPPTTVIVWTPICQETLHTDGARERTRRLDDGGLISPSLTGLGIIVL